MWLNVGMEATTTTEATTHPDLKTPAELNALVLAAAAEFPTELSRAEVYNYADLWADVCDMGRWESNHWGPVGVTSVDPAQKDWPEGPFTVQITIDGYESVNLSDRDDPSIFSGEVAESYSTMSVDIDIRLV